VTTRAARQLGRCIPGKLDKHRARSEMALAKKRHISFVLWIIDIDAVFSLALIIRGLKN
jgi:hypothetical protein